MGFKLLVVDDEEVVIEGCRRILEAQGHVVQGAGSLQEAMQKINGFAPDLVIADLMMPGGSGLDLVRALREKDPDLSVIMITGYGTVEIAVEAIKSGADEYISKPFTPEQLTQAVDSALEKRRIKVERERVEGSLRQLMESMEEDTDPQPLMEKIVDIIGMFPHVEECRIHLIHPSHRQQTTMAEQGPSGLPREDIVQGQKGGPSNVLSIPLRFKDQAAAVLEVRFFGSHVPTDKEKEILRGFAGSASAMLAKAFAFKSLRRQIASMREAMPPFRNPHDQGEKGGP